MFSRHCRSPSRVLWHLSTRPGEDIARCRESDLAAVIKGPSSKRQAILNAVNEYCELGGIPRLRLSEWSQAPLGQPLPASSAAAAPSFSAWKGNRKPFHVGGDGRNGWSMSPK